MHKRLVLYSFITVMLPEKTIRLAKRDSTLWVNAFQKLDSKVSLRMWKGLLLTERVGIRRFPTLAAATAIRSSFSGGTEEREMLKRSIT